MNKHLFFILLFCLSANVYLGAQEDSTFKHFYVKITGSELESYEYEFGQILYGEKNDPERIPFDQHSAKAKEAFFTNIQSTLSKNTIDKNDIWVYIHGMWGHLEDYFIMNTRSMYENMYEHEKSNCGVAISFIWDSKSIYETNVKIARSKGKFFAQVTEKLIEQLAEINEDIENKHHLQFLCHSMGNTVFESMFEELNKTTYQNPPIQTLIHAASDQNGNVYDKEGSMHEIKNIVDNVHILMHNNDRTLMLSKLAKDHTRMGLDGLDHMDEIPNNIQIINVSLVNDDEDMVSRFSKHRYFYSSPGIRNDIISIFLQIPHDKIAMRKFMNKKKGYKLLFPEKS